MVFLFFLLLPLSLCQEPLHDGVVTTSSIDTQSGGDLSYEFFLNMTLPGKSLFLTTTTFSDWSSPEVYISAGTPPTREVHDYAASPMNVEEIEIPGEELRDKTEYFVLIHCQTYCRFSIVVCLSEAVRLPRGSPVRFALDKDQEQAFTYEVIDPSSYLTLMVTPLSPSHLFDMFVNEGGLYGDPKSVTTAWPAGKSCLIPNPKRTVYWVSVVAKEALSFLVAGHDGSGVEELIASRPTYGVVGEQQWQYYKVFIDDANSTVYVTQTVYSGEFSVYIKALLMPTEHSYDLISQRYDNETISIDPHQRESLGVITGWYYIGILGQTPSAYILTASVNQDGMVPLYAGVPYSGFVDLDEKFYFYMDLPAQATIRVSVKAQAASGAVSVFMKLCNEWILSDKCKISDEEVLHYVKYPGIKASMGEFGYEEVAFLHEQTQCQGTICRYTILVLGETRAKSNFVIVTSFDDSTEHNLMNGLPMSFTLAQNQKMFFRHSVVDVRTIKVNFLLTVFSGKCSLCISSTEEKPLPPVCQKSSDHRLDPHEQTLSYTKGLDLESLNQSYYLTISSTTSCAFSILSSQVLPNATSVIRLFPGLMQRDVLYAEDGRDEFRWYSFELRYTMETMKDVYVSLTPFTGGFEVMVANNASRVEGIAGDFRYDWSINGEQAGSQRENLLHIATSDPSYLPSSTYLLLVRVKSWSPSNTASYSLLFTSGDGSMTLQAGVPLSDIVAMGQFRYYRLPVRNKDQSITVAVSAVTGDPDLYVSVSGEKPGIEKSDEASVNYGSEVLTILWQSHNHTCPDQSCHLSIAVYGYTDSAYSIVTSVENDNPIYIVPGMLQAGKAEMSEYRFYYTFVNAKQWFQINVESLVGEVTIYLTLLPVRIDSSVDFSLPSVSSHHYQSDPFPHSSHISLQEVNITQHCGNSRCRADISVHCETEDCRFSTSVTQSDELQLMEGSPQNGDCKREKPVFFKFYNEKDSTNIIARVAGVTSGDPDLYISKGVKPTTTTAMWRSVSWGNEFLEIPTTDSIIGPSMMKGEFYLLILCDRDMSFTVSVTTNSKALIRLIDGQPHSGYLHGPVTDYFYYPSALPSDIVISLTVASGNAVVYAVMSDDREEDIYEKLPSESVHYWKSSIGSLLLPQSDPHFCTSCNVLISVSNLENSCLYTLLARNHGHITSLLNGQPFEGRLAPSQSRKYVFQHFADASLDISLSVFAGEPLMSVATTPLVSRVDYNWTTNERMRAKHLHIEEKDAAFHKGLYYILVYSEGEAAYSLTAHSEGSVVRLVTGWPQTYSCQFRTNTPLLFEYIVDGTPGVCKVTSLTAGFSPSVYAKFTNLTSSTSLPSAEFSDQTYTDYDIFYQMKMKLWEERPGKYIFSVYGNSTKDGKDEEMGDFQIFCLSANREKVISLREVEYGVLDTESQIQVYKLNTPRSGTLNVVATPCAGKLELSITTSNSNSKAEITIKRVEDGRITADFPCVSGVYYIYVSVVETEELTKTVSFQLTTALNSAGQVEPQMYYAGNTGLIDWSQAGEDDVQLTWSPPELQSGDLIPNPQLTKYRVYATVKNITLTSACGMDVYERMEKAWLALEGEEQFGETTARVKVPVGVKVWVNVMAIVDPEAGREIYHVPYTVVEIFIEDKEEERRDWEVVEGLGAVVLLLLVIILVLSWKYLKAKKLQMQLVEMLDVETITKDFNKSLKSTRKSPSIEFAPINQDSSMKEEPSDE